MAPSRYSDLKPADLALKYGVSGMRMRSWLRQRYPDTAPGSGGRWLLTDDQVDAVRQYFGVNGPSRPSTGPSMAVATAATDEWYWEGNVQRVLVRHLRAGGWTIISQADAGRRERGHDVVANRRGTALFVEVKGYPSTNYRDPRRAAEVKRTNPSLQAKHWFAEALLKAVRTRVAEPAAAVAICFPLAVRYETLIHETMPMLARMEITVLVVDEQGAVTTRALPYIDSK